MKVIGRWQMSQPGTKQACELHAESIEISGYHDAGVREKAMLASQTDTENVLQNFPLQKKYHTLDYLRTVPHLRVRLPHNALILRLRSQVMAHLSIFFNDRSFVQAHTPIITSSDCEGGGEVFSVSSSRRSERNQNSLGAHAQQKDFFSSEKFLTVSSQLHLEALAQSVGRVWTLSPTFRAERSDTPRHLSEFYMLEAEICFIDSLEPIMELLEDMLCFVVDHLQSSKVGEELLKAARKIVNNDGTGTELTSDALSARWNGMLKRKWPRITFSEALKTLQSAQTEGRVNFLTTPTSSDGLTVEHERFLVLHVGNGQPVFITGFPARLKPFYVPSSSCSSSVAAIFGPGHGNITQSFDLLVPDVCELAGGSTREHHPEKLFMNMKSRGMLDDGEGSCHTSDTSSSKLSNNQRSSKNSLTWYMDLRRYGSAPHGGFGLGFDRLISYVSGVSNVRDVVTFPRWYGRCDC